MGEGEEEEQEEGRKRRRGRAEKRQISSPHFYYLNLTTVNPVLVSSLPTAPSLSSFCYSIMVQAAILVTPSLKPSLVWLLVPGCVSGFRGLHVTPKGGWNLHILPPSPQVSLAILWVKPSLGVGFPDE